MKKLYIIIISLFLTIFSSAQTYYQIGLPGTDATAVIQNPAGNFVVAGYTFVTGTNADVLLYEIDAISGTVIRSKQFSSTNLDLPYSICNTPDGNYLVTGYTTVTTTDNDLFVAKVDTGFNPIWYRQMGVAGSNSNDYGNSVEVLNSGIYAVTGTIALGGSAKPSIIYLNDSGNVINEFHLNTNQFASPNFKAKYLQNGTFGFIHLTNDLCIVDTSGVILKNDSSNFGIYTTDMLRNPNGDYVVLYSNYGGLQGGSAVLCIYDSSGSNLLMSTKLSITGNDVEPKQVLMDNGDYLISANAVNLGSGASNGVLFKVTSAGNLIWSRKYTSIGVGASSINSLMIASDGNYVVAGSEGLFPNTALYIVKMDSSGNVCQSVNVSISMALPVKNTVTTHSINVGTTQVISTTFPSVIATSDSTIILCTSISGVEEFTDYTYSHYPNPANDVLFYESTFSGESIGTIYSFDGKVVLTQRLNTKAQINIHSLSSGVYMFRINDSSGKLISVQKFLKN